MITFDERGNICPYEVKNIPLDEFKKTFVENFGESSSRSSIYNNFYGYIIDFQKYVDKSVRLWVNGSFVTLKDNPKDIDFVNLISNEIYTEKENIITERFSSRGADKYYSVDAYTLRVYNENHPKSLLTQQDMLYWYHWFTKTRMNRAKIRFPKGFIELKID